MLPDVGIDVAEHVADLGVALGTAVGVVVGLAFAFVVVRLVWQAVDRKLVERDHAIYGGEPTTEAGWARLERARQRLVKRGEIYEDD